MNKLPICIIAFLAVLSVGCTNRQNTSSENELLRLDFTQRLEERPIVLNDISEKISLVRLETNEDCQLSYFSGYAGDNVIISRSSNKLMQFDRNGKYLKTIAVKGQGPGEFVQIDAMDIDDKEKLLLYHDREKNYIYRYKLDAMEYDHNIPFKDEGFLAGIIGVNDTTLAIFSTSFSSYENLWFFQNIDGKILAGKKRPTIQNPGIWAGMWPVFLKTQKNKILYQPSDIDTVFQIVEDTDKSAMVLSTDKPITNGQDQEGNSVRLLYSGESHTLFSMYHYQKTQTANSASMSINKIDYILLDKRNNKLTRGNPLSVEYEGIDFEVWSINMQDYGSFYIQIQALEFMNKIKDALENNELSDNNRLRIMELLNSISEDDNPILFIGKLLI